MEAQIYKYREYATNLEMHYKLKKEVFAQTVTNLNDQIVKQSIDLRSVRTENKENSPTTEVKLETQVLTKQRDCAAEKEVGFGNFDKKRF